MNPGSYAPLALVSRVLVGIGWAWFFVFFVFRRRAKNETETRSEPASKAGIFLQMASFVALWMLQRPLPRAGVPLGVAETVLDILAPILSFVSAWIGLTAVRTLGKEWSYQARLVEGHRLVTEGPYAFVRHPIYTGMFGKLLAANFAFGHWLGLLIAMPLFLVGTWIRIRSEEKLLRDAFGSEYEAYARRVRGLVPFVV